MRESVPMPTLASTSSARALCRSAELLPPYRVRLRFNVTAFVQSTSGYYKNGGRKWAGAGAAGVKRSQGTAKMDTFWRAFLVFCCLHVLQAHGANKCSHPCKPCGHVCPMLPPGYSIKHLPLAFSYCRYRAGGACMLEGGMHVSMM